METTTPSPQDHEDKIIGSVDRLASAKKSLTDVLNQITNFANQIETGILTASQQRECGQKIAELAYEGHKHVQDLLLSSCQFYSEFAVSGYIGMQMMLDGHMFSEEYPARVTKSDEDSVTVTAQFGDGNTELAFTIPFSSSTFSDSGVPQAGTPFRLGVDYWKDDITFLEASGMLYVPATVVAEDEASVTVEMSIGNETVRQSILRENLTSQEAWKVGTPLNIHFSLLSDSRKDLEGKILDDEDWIISVTD